MVVIKAGSLWKRGETPRDAGDETSTEIFRERKGFSTERKDAEVFHGGVFLFHGRRWKTWSPLGGDVGLDLLHRFGEGGVLFHLLFHLVDGGKAFILRRQSLIFQHKRTALLIQLPHSVIDGRELYGTQK